MIIDLDENDHSEEELKIITQYKRHIYDLIDAYDLETSKSIKNELIGVTIYLNEFIKFYGNLLFLTLNT